MSNDSTAPPAFRMLVVEAVRIVGSQKILAQRIARSQQQISNLCRRAARISGEDAIAIDRATAGRISAAALRPDLWRRPEDVPADAARSAGHAGPAPAANAEDRGRGAG